MGIIVHPMSGCTAAPATPVVEMGCFSFRYGQEGPWAVNDVSVTINAGETVFIGGASGSGKSTLCAAMSGQVPFTIDGQMKGSVSLFSRDVWSWTPAGLAGKVGHVFQNADEQLVTFTVFEEIAFAAENLCLPEQEIKERVVFVAERLGIASLLDRPIGCLSGGEKQKVVIASNLVMRPDILILDEPLAFLDAAGERALVAMLRDLRDCDEHLVIVIVEHRLSPFLPLVDKMIVLSRDGHLAFMGPAEEYHAWASTRNHDAIRAGNTIEPLAGLLDKVNHGKSPGGALLHVERVSFSYPGIPPVFTNLDLEICRGETLGITGDNGCGKTTLLLLLAGVLTPSDGCIFFDGQRLEDIPQRDLLPRVGFIFQNPENQLFEGTVRDEILYGPAHLVPDFHERAAEVRDAMVDEQARLLNEGRVSLDILARRNPFKLSWGQKRRLNLGSVLSYDPEVLLLDEPFIGQDAGSVAAIQDILEDARNKGKTIILVSHDLDIVHQLCSRVVHLPSISTTCPDTTLEPVNVASKPERRVNKGKARRKRKMLDDLVDTTFSTSLNDSSPVHFNPVAKLVVLAWFTVALFFQGSLVTLGIVYLLTFLIACSIEKDRMALLRRLRWMFLLVLVSVPLNALFDATIHPGEDVLFFLFPPFLPIRRVALHVTLRAGLAVLAMFTSSMAFARATPVKHIVHGFIGAGVPYRHAFALMVGLRYIPLVRNEAAIIAVAQHMRGVSLTRRAGVRAITKHLVGRVSTLLLSLFRKIATTATSMDARAFGIFPTRTSLVSVPFTRKDWALVLVAAMASMLAIAYGLGVFPTLLPPSVFSILGSLLP